MPFAATTNHKRKKSEETINLNQRRMSFEKPPI